MKFVCSLSRFKPRNIWENVNTTLNGQYKIRQCRVSTPNKFTVSYGVIASVGGKEAYVGILRQTGILGLGCNYLAMTSKGFEGETRKAKEIAKAAGAYVMG